MVRRLFAALSRTLSKVRSAIRQFAGTAHDEPHAARVYWDEGVALTLTDLMRESETRASGRVQVITLGEFRSAVGELWEKYEPRILLIAESTISRMIGRGNTFIPQDKDTWLLLFPALKEAEALKRADAIAARIGEKLVGARFSEMPPPLPEASKLDLRGALNADGSLNLDRVKAAVEHVRQSTSLGLGAVKTAAKRAASPVARPAGVAAASSPPAKSEAAQLTVAFRPAWNAETQSVNSFFFRATKSDGSDVYGAHGPCPTDATALELVGLACRAFSDMCERGLRAVLTVPIPFPALQGPLLADFQRAITSLPQRERLLHLRLEVTHVPLRAGADSLAPIRELFRPYTREVAFLLDPFQLSDQVLALDHIMVGVEMPRGGRRTDDEIFQALLNFRQRAGRRTTYVLGLSSRLQVAHAVTASIAEIGGSGVAGELKKLPDQVTVIRRQDLLL
jgi:hypothetical protein